VDRSDEVVRRRAARHRSVWLLQRRVRAPRRAEAPGSARQTAWPLLLRPPAMKMRDGAGLPRSVCPPAWPHRFPGRPQARPERPSRLAEVARRDNPGTPPRWGSVMESAAEARGRDRASRPWPYSRGPQVQSSPAQRPQASRRAASSALEGERRPPASCVAGAPARRRLAERGRAETALPAAWTATERSTLPAHRRTRRVDRLRVSEPAVAASIGAEGKYPAWAACDDGPLIGSTPSTPEQNAARKGGGAKSVAKSVPRDRGLIQPCRSISVQPPLLR